MNNDMNNNFNNGNFVNNTNVGMGGIPQQSSMNPGTGNTSQQPSNSSGMNMYPNYNVGYNNVPQYQPYPMNMPQEPKKTMNLPLIIGGAIGIIAIIVLILFLTGVLGGTKLTCTKEDSFMGMTMKESAVISFKDDKPNSATFKETIDYGTNSYYKESLKEDFEDELEDYKEDGLDAQLISDDTSYTLVIKYKKDDLGTTSYEETKQEFEEDGYTCK